MIKSFKCKETKKIWDQIRSKKFSMPVQKIALRKLFMMHRAKNLNDLRIPPANCLEMLKGDRDRQHSIRINSQWRICFVWENGDIYNAEIVDYH